MTALCQRELSVLDYTGDALESELLGWWLDYALSVAPEGDESASVLDCNRAASATTGGGCDVTK
jgi:hypothetical protein